MTNWNPIEGETFGQEERLTIRLRGLIRSYPRSVGIIKEFLQNADDAGATWLRVIWDERAHPREQLPDPRMAVLQGPALVLVSDQVFASTDFDAIRRIGESSKSELGPKTGRFGLGFNTAYNVTDYPAFVSDRWAVVFDPHRRCVDADGEGTGRRWELADLWQFAPDVLRAFAAGGLGERAASHPETIFRLPVRDAAQAAQSEICDEPFERQHFDQMVKDLIDAGDELLLFARNVLDLRVERIDAGGAHHELLRLTTLDRDAVIARRAAGNAAVEGDLAANIAAWRVAGGDLPQTTYRHSIEVVAPTKKEVRPWQIAAGLFVDEVGELLRLNEAMLRLKEKAIPWAGAAVRLELRDDGSAIVANQRGKLFCTFPLAEQPEQLVCHLNACFDLDSSRRQLSLDASAYAEADRARVAWNTALFRHALPRAAALVIGALAPDIAAAGPGRFYALWPDLSRGEEPFRTFAAGLLSRLAELPLVRTRAGEDITWESLESTVLPPPLWGPDLQEALRDDGLRLPDPDVPPRIVRSADLANVRTRRYRPGELRDWLRTDEPFGVRHEDAPRACLRERAHVVDLLQFCISDRKDDIAGLPLALTCDGLVRTFGRGGELFLGDDTTRRIFADHPEWFVEPAIQQHTRLQPCAPAQLLDMNPERVVGRLALRLSLAPDETLAWDPDGEAPPNAAWLVLVLRYLADKVPPAAGARLSTFALFPDPNDRLRCAAAGVLLIPSDDLDRNLRAAINAIGVELVAGGFDVVEAVRHFQSKHPGPIAALTGPSLAARLPARSQALAALPAESKERAALLDYLAAPRWFDHYGPDELAALRRVPLLRTLEGRIVAADTPRVFLPGDFRPPPLVDTPIELVDTGASGRWRAFLERLGVPEIRAARYLADVLLPTFASLDPGLQRAALLWLRDDVDLRGIDRDDPALAEQVRATPLLRARDGQLHPASHLHQADDAAAAGPAVGRQARTPDMEFYRGDRDRWAMLFLWLGVRKDPRPETLLDELDAALARAADDPEAARRGLAELFALVAERWPTLSESEALRDGLRARAWLPALQDSLAAGFVPALDRLYRPDELFPPDALELIASQGPVLAAPRAHLDPALRAALGLREPTAADIVAHLDHLRGLWARDDHGDLSPGALGAATSAIYAELGRPERHVPQDILDGLAARPCVWDPERQRFWPPAHVFTAPVADLFGDLRAHVPGDNDAVRRGLMHLGCRPSPDVGDIASALQAVQARAADQPLADADLALTLRLLRRVLDLPTTDAALAALLVPTRDGRLRRAAEVRLDDAPWYSARIAAGALPFVHPRVGADVIERLGLRRLSTITQEQLAERPALSGSGDKQHFCRQLTETIHHRAFASGVARILAHQGAGGRNLGLLGELRVIATDRLVTHLKLAGVDKPLGAEEVAVFADAGQRVVYVSGEHWDSVVVQIGEAINRLLDSALKNLADLEAVLRTSPDEVLTLLDHRRVPRLHDEPEPAPAPTTAAPRPAPATPRPAATNPLQERVALVEPTEIAAPAVDVDVHAAAVAYALAFEREAGRSPRVNEKNHPAYDIMSGELSDPNGRFIRVVGLDGAWDELRVVLPSNHYSAGRIFGRNFWLYVVEHTLDPSRTRLHRLHDPVNRVARFVLDHRWSSQSERNAFEMTRYVGWLHTPPGGERGVIELVESTGMFVWMHVRLPDGRLERRFYKPGLDQLTENPESRGAR